jgi:hypothetical protein
LGLGIVVILEVVHEDNCGDEQIDGRKKYRQHGDLLS